MSLKSLNGSPIISGRLLWLHCHQNLLAMGPEAAVVHLGPQRRLSLALSSLLSMHEQEIQMLGDDFRNIK